MSEIPQDTPPDDSTLTSAGEGASVLPTDAAEPQPKSSRPFRNRFPIQSIIGKGGMGEVFLALDRSLHREVAVKLLRQGRADDVAVHRFLRESQVTAQLDHPNVVPVHTLEVTEQGDPALVMKRVRGVDLKDYLATCRKELREQSFSTDERGLRIRVEHFLKICDAIAFAHDRGVVHRDLKPANVMLGDYGEVYVMDWGIARVAGKPEIERDEHAAEVHRRSVTDTSGLETSDANFVGTPAYMAPEQSRPDGPVTGPAADQFGLGMLLQELLTLRAPREGHSSTELIEAAELGSRTPCEEIEGAEPIPPALKAVVERACAVDPSERYDSVEEFALDLRRWQRNEELDAYPDNLLRAAWRKLEHHPMRAMSGLLFIIISAAAVTTYSLFEVVQTQASSAEQLKLITGLLENTSSHLLTKEREAAMIREEIAAIAVAVETELRRDQVDRGFHFPRPDALNAGELNPRYKQVVDFTTPVAITAPDADLAAVAAEEEHLSELGQLFTNSFLRALELHPGKLAPEAELARLQAQAKDALQYAFVGTESGLIINYPGVPMWPADYDPRVRPWYHAAVDAEGTVFGIPHADASGSGYLLPCVRAIHGPDGELAGVVGISIRLESVLDSLAPPDLKPRYGTLLVNGDGGIIARDGERDSVGPMENLVNTTKKIVPLKVPEVVDRILAEQTHGFEFVDDELYIFSRFDALGWYLVLIFDTKEVLGRSS